MIRILAKMEFANDSVMRVNATYFDRANGRFNVLAIDYPDNHTMAASNMRLDMQNAIAAAVNADNPNGVNPRTVATSEDVLWA